MSRGDIIRLRHMLDAAREAVGFIRDKSRTDLEHDRMLVLALVKALEIVGEAAFQTSSATRERIPDIPWEDIIGMRHRLVHGYFDFNLDILWNTAQHDLPPLIALLERFLSENA